VSIDVPEVADLEQVRERWRTAVAGVLSKSTRKDPGELGDVPERLLETPTYDGIAIRALYTALDELPEPPLPGEWPYVRGGDALRDVNSGWKVAEVFPAPGRDDSNAAVLAAARIKRFFIKLPPIIWSGGPAAPSTLQEIEPSGLIRGLQPFREHGFLSVPAAFRLGARP